MSFSQRNGCCKSRFADPFTDESYEYKKIDLDNQADKEFFEGAMAWDLVVDGKEWADGKNFK